MLRLFPRVGTYILRTWFLLDVYFNLFTGAQNLLRAFTVSDLPADPEQIFLTSWGEWWPKDVYALSLDTKLQDKWCLSLEEIEKEEGLSNQ